MGSLLQIVNMTKLDYDYFVKLSDMFTQRSTITPAMVAYDAGKRRSSEDYAYLIMMIMIMNSTTISELRIRRRPNNVPDITLLS